MSLLPVLREERPKIFFTLSIIKLKRLTDQKWNCRYVLPGSLWSKVHRIPRRRLGGGGVGAGAGCRRIPKSRWKKLRGAGVAAGTARAAAAAARRRTSDDQMARNTQTTPRFLPGHARWPAQCRFFQPPQRLSNALCHRFLHLR